MVLYAALGFMYMCTQQIDFTAKTISHYTAMVPAWEKWMMCNFMPHVPHLINDVLFQILSKHATEILVTHMSQIRKPWEYSVFMKMKHLFDQHLPKVSFKNIISFLGYTLSKC